MEAIAALNFRILGFNFCANAIAVSVKRTPDLETPCVHTRNNLRRLNVVVTEL